MADILIIGYGNELRGDDGLGLFVAEAVAAANIPGVRVLTARQLLPEFAAELAQAKLAIFVDASVESKESGIAVRLQAVTDTMDWYTHHASPGALLALTQATFKRAPDAWWLTVAGRHFEQVEGLSDWAEENARQALACLKGFIKDETRHRFAGPLH